MRNELFEKNSAFYCFLYVIKRKKVASGPKNKDRKNQRQALRPCNCASAVLSKVNVPQPIKYVSYCMSIIRITFLCFYKTSTNILNKN